MDYDGSPCERRILEILGLSVSFDNAAPLPERKKPFDLRAEGLPVQRSRDDRQWKLPDDLTGMELLHAAIARMHGSAAEESSSLASASL